MAITLSSTTVTFNDNSTMTSLTGYNTVGSYILASNYQSFPVSSGVTIAGTSLYHYSNFDGVIFDNNGVRQGGYYSSVYSNDGIIYSDGSGLLFNDAFSFPIDLFLYKGTQLSGTWRATNTVDGTASVQFNEAGVRAHLYSGGLFCRVS